MNEKDVATLIWQNGNIQPKEKIFSNLDFSFIFHNQLVECFLTFGTDILFFNETFSKIQSSLNIYHIDSVLFSDNTGDSFKKETKRLLIRNKCYKTARCYIVFSISIETNSLNEYIFLIPDPQLFSVDKTIKKTIVSNRLLKPSGIVMNFSTMVKEFRKIIQTEMEHEKVDDCIILNLDQNIVESYLGNIFLITPGEVITPSLNSGCTPYLLRKITISLFENLGFQVIEKDDMQVENLLDANEVVVAGETGIYALKGIEYKRYFDNVRKALISKVVEAGLD
jgi:branched-subunit amino acid aminotransferase/4-amino-4-deoxychorismate lyase